MCRQHASGRKKTRSRGVLADGSLIVIFALVLLLSRSLDDPQRQPSAAPTATASATAERPTHTPSPENRVAYTAIANLSARSCPSLDCSTELRLRRGDRVMVTGEIRGDSVNRSRRWWIVIVDGQTVYIHSSQLAPVQVTATLRPFQLATASPPALTGGYTCNCSRTCSRIETCDEAYFQLRECGCTGRDGDEDGIPCESLCGG